MNKDDQLELRLGWITNDKVEKISYFFQDASMT